MSPPLLCDDCQAIVKYTHRLISGGSVLKDTKKCPSIYELSMWYRRQIQKWIQQKGNFTWQWWKFSDWRKRVSAFGFGCQLSLTCSWWIVWIVWMHCLLLPPFLTIPKEAFSTKEENAMRVRRRQASEGQFRLFWTVRILLETWCCGSPEKMELEHYGLHVCVILVVVAGGINHSLYIVSHQKWGELQWHEFCDSNDWMKRRQIRK